MRPWRQVVHVEERTPTARRAYWFLTLDCGHHAVRNKRGPRKTDGARLMQPPSYAPKKVRCSSCRPALPT